MRHSERSFTTSTGRIYYRHWKPATRDPTALILIVHGAAEHSGRYRHVAEHFVKLGYSVAALDHPGHGRSEGKRSYIDSFETYLKTLDCFRKVILDSNPKLPLLLLGHSMGGLISAHYVIRHQDSFSGLILSGPAIKPAIPIRCYQRALIRILAIAAPRVGVLQLDASGISRDPAEVERYVTDPLVYTGKGTARFLDELLKATDRLWTQIAKIQLPVLVLHGEADQMVAAEGSRQFVDRVSSTNKQLIIYPDLYHELFNEPEKDQVLKDIEDWLAALLA